jgi:hypothetical protein
MYAMVRRTCMTYGDRKFMMEVGIEPCTLDDPFPRPLAPRLPPGPVIPSLTEKDACWLLSLGVRWEREPEPDFIPPRSLREYLSGHPNGIRDAVGDVAKEMGLAMLDSGLDDLAQDIEQMFLDFAALGFEDVVGLYGFYKSMRPGLCGVGGFHAYVKLRMAACVPVVLKDDPHGDSNG